ncbi:PQQ-binding-like beta-propeller repeat protein [Nibricoccus sp. IMCC34717]
MLPYWKRIRAQRGFGAPTLTDEMILIGSADGNLYALGAP